MFNNILVPLDGSELAEKIIPTVEGLAKAHDAKVTLLTVGYVEPTYGLGQASDEARNEALEREKNASEEYLKEKAQELSDKGVDADWTYEVGMPAWEIVAQAEKKNADLIAIATHGSGEVAWTLGSTSARVTTHSPVPVLLHRVMEFKPPALKQEWFLGA